jgi:N-acetylglucosaminyl-diphospho-decaprenol L-rhamnosyltransferase
MISIVIVNWNSGDLLERCLRSLAANAVGCEVIVVDNASEDGSLESACAAAPSVTVLRNDANMGFAAANNRGWRASRGNPVLFLNPDTESMPGSVSKLADSITQDSTVWAAGGKLIGNSGKSQAGFNVRSFPTVAAVAGELLLLDKLWPGNPWTRRYRRSDQDLQCAADVEQPAAACLMVTRSALETLGGFDESFYPAWFEDVDLCKRIRSCGGRIRFQPAARFLHHGGCSLLPLGNEKFLISFHGSQIRYFAKHEGTAAARQVRNWVILGMLLRAVLSLIHPIAPNQTRASSVRIYWNAARHFAALSGVRQ